MYRLNDVPLHFRSNGQNSDQIDLLELLNLCLEESLNYFIIL